MVVVLNEMGNIQYLLQEYKDYTKHTQMTKAVIYIGFDSFLT